MRKGYQHIGASRDGEITTHGLDPDGAYEVVVVPRTVIGARGDIEDGGRTNIAVRGQDRQPADVTNFAGEYCDGWVIFRWDCVADKDVRGYQVRRVDGSTGLWLGGIVVVECVFGTTYRMPADYIGTTTYAIKAVNTTGLQSDNHATSSVEIPSAEFTTVASQDEHTGWSGTKTKMTTSSGELVLSASQTSGSYESNSLTVGVLDYYQVMLSLDTDVSGPTTAGDLFAIRGSSAYAKRRAGNIATWEGTENLEHWRGDSALDTGDGLYADTFAGNASYRFWENVTFTVEYAYTTNGGSSWSSWIPWQPVVRQLDGVKFKVSVTVPHTDINVALESMTAHIMRTHSAGRARTVRAISGDDTALTADDVITVDASGGGITLNLYAASGNGGLGLVVKKTDSTANTVIIDGSGSETIDGATTKTLLTQYAAINIVCDGSKWHTVSEMGTVT